MHTVIEFSAAGTHARFHRLPKAIARARSTVSPEGVTGYLLFANEAPCGLTGMLFCDQDCEVLHGLLVSTGHVRDRAWVEEYELLITVDGGVYVIATWLSEMGAHEALKTIH